MSTSVQRVRLGDYLVQRLYDAGVKDFFGVPGDFSLGLFNHFVDGPVNYVGCCNELNAAYAADGYARVNGIGCVGTTYAVGELSAVNGVAGAYAENVPVVKLTGAPTRKHFEKQPLLHHTLGDYMKPYEVYKNVVVAHTILNDPRTAAAEIDRVLKACLTLKRPVYMAVPSDMCVEMIEADQGPWVHPVEPASHPAVLEDCLNEIMSMLDAASRPVFMPGVELIRRNLQQTFRTLTDKSNIPFVTMLLSKGLLEEEHPNFLGLYSGGRSRPAVRDAVEQSDCVVVFGERFTDFNTGGFSSKIEDCNKVFVSCDSVTVRTHTYNNIYISAVLEGLVKRIGARDRAALYKGLTVGSEACVHRRNAEDKNLPDTDKLSMNSVFARMAKFIPENSIVIAETGASLFSIAETMLPRGCTFIGQTFYGSIGFSVGACLGACVAARERPVVLFVGDGSFQLTAQEVSTMIRYGLNPLVILVNNDGYTIERVITDNIYNDIQMWQYAQLPAVFGGKAGTVVKTEGDLKTALNAVDYKDASLKFVEVVLDRWDCNQLLKDAGRTMALANNLIKDTA